MFVNLMDKVTIRAMTENPVVDVFEVLDMARRRAATDERRLYIDALVEYARGVTQLDVTDSNA